MAGFPYGDAFIVETPHLDAAANRLYAQEQQRKQMGYNEYLATQQQLSKEFANVRSADVPDAIKAYNDWKYTKQQMLFNPKVKNNPNEYALAQQKEQESLGNLRQLINGSTQLKDQDKSLSEDLVRNRDLYHDQAGAALSNWMQMPLKDRVANGYISATPLLYQGTNTDFGALEKTAIGEQKASYLPETKSADGLSFEQKGFVRGNNPLQFYAMYSGELAKRKAGQDASAAYKQIPTELKQEIEQDFNDIPDSDWQKWGIPKPNLSQDHGQSDAEKFAILKAQQYAVMNPPQDADVKTRDNKAAISDLQLQKEKEMEGIRQANRVSLSKLNDKLVKGRQEGNQQNVNSSIDDLVAGQIEFAKNPFNKGLPLPVDPATLKTFDVDALRLSNDGAHIIPEWTDKDGTVKFGSPMRVEDYKAALGKRNVGAKYFQSKGVSGIKPIEKTTTEKTYKAANGKSYNQQELLKLGYSEQQIQDAIKLGNLQ